MISLRCSKLQQATGCVAPVFGIPAVVVDRAVYPVVGGVLAATVVGTATATASDSTLPVAQCSSVADAALAAG